MESENQQTRRQFCRQCSAGLAALSGVAMLQACGGGGPTSSSGGSFGGSSLPVVNGASAGGGIQVTIDAASPLASPGSMAFVQSSLGSVLVAHTGTDTFIAVTSTCTHQGCAITGFSGSNYVCPCHGSQFDANGRVLNGPASRSLQQFNTQFANGVLTITA
jgi:nitrite reductase/ring-hydroxylating ferredoxin subunit